MSLARAAQLHDLSIRNEIHPVLIDDPLLRTFARTLRAFERGLGEVAQDDYWRDRLRTLKRYRFRVCATPLGFDDPQRTYADLFGDLAKSLKNAHLLYPNAASGALELVSLASDLARREDNPVLSALERLQLEEGALLLSETRFVSPTEILLSKHLSVRHLHVLTSAQLRTGDTYEHLVLVGPMRWFPDHVMTAPCSEIISQLRFTFLGDGWRPRAGLIRPLTRHVHVGTKVEAELPDDDPISAEEVLPEVDWDAATRPYLKTDAASQDELAEARLVLLAEDNAVFLEADGSELVIEPSRPNPVTTVRVSQLTKDLFLMVRDKGQGAYIVPIANRILGGRAEECRAAQNVWKRELRKAVTRDGYARTLDRLRLYGARSASRANVRNWMSLSERKIRPRYREDFAAIMALIDLPHETERYWRIAKAINQSHRRAGVEMKRQLLAVVRNASTDNLERKGRQQFNVGEYQTNLNAYRVLGVAGPTYRVPFSQLGELISVEENAWRG